MATKKDEPKLIDEMTDLGLTYVQAMHGVQTAIAYSISNGGRSTEPKHMRVGVDMGKSDMLGLAALLIDKGVITDDEYTEYMRRAANQELATREAEVKAITNATITFR